MDLPELYPLTLSPLPDNPLVTVISSNYNYGRFLPETIRSVMDQTYNKTEYIICDDGSTDDSVAVVERLSRKMPNLSLIKKENGGQASAWNAAVEQSSGDIICLLDSDDLFRPKKIERIVATFQEHPQAGFAWHPLQRVDAKGNSVGPPIPHQLTEGWLGADVFERGGFVSSWTASSGICLRTEAARELFPVPDRGVDGLPVPWSDGYLVLTAQFLTEFTAIPDVLSIYRIHGANIYASIEMDVAELNRSLEANEAFIASIKEFVATRYGDLAAGQINLDNAELYWKYLYYLYLFNNRPRDGVHGYTIDRVMVHIPESRRKTAMRLLLHVPNPLAITLIQTWWKVAPFHRLLPRLRRMVGREKNSIDIVRAGGPRTS